jgi:hypothetical protein
MPAKGISLHIGLNGVDATHYGGWDGQLAACEADANDMKALATAQGFTSQIFLTKKATAPTVIGAIQQAAAKLKGGDLFFLSYSGHGGQVPDTNHEEPDRKDETWVLYDRELVDDELWALWGKFAAGVRIVVLSDSCHSGSVTRAMPVFNRANAGAATTARARLMPPDVALETYRRHSKLYDDIQKQNPAGEKARLRPTVVLISGCQDNQTSLDGDRNGLFTGTLRKVWKKGQFTGGHKLFRDRIAAHMPASQTPNYSVVGTPSPAFEAQKPFTI